MVLKNSTYNIVSFGVTVVITLFLTPFIIHSLGDSNYGIWALVASVCGFYGVLDLGISASVVRYVSKFIAIEKSEDANATINTALVIYSVLALLVLLFAFFGAMLLPLILKTPQGMEDTASLVLFLVGASLALSFPSRVFIGTMQALLRYDITSGVEVAINLLRAVLIVVVLKAGHGLVALSFILIVVAVLRLGLMVILAFKVYPGLRLGWRFVEKKNLREIFNYSIYKFIASLGDQLRFNLDSIVIGALVSLSAITPYAIAQRLIWYFMNFVSQVFSVTTPVYSSYEARNEIDSVRKLFIKSTFYAAFISFFTASMFILYGHTFISLWIGIQYADMAYPVLVILAISFSIALAQNPSVVTANGIEKHKVLAIITVFEGVMNLVLSLALAVKMGIVGVALGTAIPMVITKAIIQPVYICRVLDLSVIEYLKNCFFKPIAVVVLFALFHLSVKGHIHLSSFYHLVGAVLVSSFMFIVITLFFLTQEQRAFWRGHLSGLKQRLVP